MLLLICRGIAGAGMAIGSLVVTSLSVQIWLQPLLACYFNRISWVSALANLLIVPFHPLYWQPALFAAFAAGLPSFGPELMRFAGTLALSCCPAPTG